MNFNFSLYYDAPRHSIIELIEDLHTVASRDEFFNYSSFAAEWMREIERMKALDDMSGADYTKIKHVINLSCDILRDSPEMNQITTISLVEQLKKKISDCAANSEHGLYSISDIGIITSILFDSFRMCRI